MSKQKITIDSKQTVLDVKQITLTVEQLKVAMNNVYEASHTRAKHFCWHDLYAPAFSASATLLITCLTTTFKDLSNNFSWLNPNRMAFVAWVIIIITFIFGIICLCKKSHKNDNVFVDRDDTVQREIKKLHSKNEEINL